MKIDYTHNTDPAYRAELDQAFEALPDKLKGALEADGWKIRAGTTLKDAGGDELDRLSPTINEFGTKQHERTSGVSVRPGTDSPLAKTILLGQHIHNWDDELIDADQGPETMRHEVGHGIDHLADRFSYSDAFTKAYQQDIADLYNPQKTDMETRKKAEKYLKVYIKQNDDSSNNRRKAQSEAFAELSAHDLGGAKKGDDLAEALPRSRALSRQVVNNLANGHKADHGIDRGQQVYVDDAKGKMDGLDFADDVTTDLKGWRAQRQAKAELASEAVARHKTAATSAPDPTRKSS